MSLDGERGEKEERKREREEIEMEMCRLASRWLRRLLVYSPGSAITSRPACVLPLCAPRNRLRLDLIQPSMIPRGDCSRGSSLDDDGDPRSIFISFSFLRESFPSVLFLFCPSPSFPVSTKFTFFFSCYDSKNCYCCVLWWIQLRKHV